MRVIFKYLFALFLTMYGFMGCAHREPKDLSILNNESLDLSKKFISESSTSSTGLRNFTSSAGGSGCGVCAH